MNKTFQLAYQADEDLVNYGQGMKPAGFDGQVIRENVRDPER